MLFYPSPKVFRSKALRQYPSVGQKKQSKWNHSLRGLLLPSSLFFALITINSNDTRDPRLILPVGRTIAKRSTIIQSSNKRLIQGFLCGVSGARCWVLSC